MSIKRQDERHNGDTVDELKSLFDNAEPDEGKAPRMRILGDRRTPARPRDREQGTEERDG